MDNHLADRKERTRHTILKSHKNGLYIEHTIFHIDFIVIRWMDLDWKWSGQKQKKEVQNK